MVNIVLMPEFLSPPPSSHDVEPLIRRAFDEDLLPDITSEAIFDPSQRGRDPKLIERDMEIHILNPKPTKNFMFENTAGFWIPLESYQAGIMADAGILKQRYTEADFKSVLRPKYLEDTYSRLGWKVPSSPPFLPADWKGVPGKPPYPAYGLGGMGPQAFPQPGDLTREWTFGGKTYKPT